MISPVSRFIDFVPGVVRFRLTRDRVTGVVAIEFKYSSSAIVSTRFVDLAGNLPLAFSDKTGGVIGVVIIVLF